MNGQPMWLDNENRYHKPLIKIFKRNTKIDGMGPFKNVECH